MHTKGKLTVEPFKDKRHRYVPILCQDGEEGRLLASVIGRPKTWGQATADANRLALCWNEHDALVRALGYFLADPRFVAAVGGNPIAVDKMMAECYATYERVKP